MICPTCSRMLELSVDRAGGRWLGFSRCLRCNPEGNWTPHGEVEVIWRPPGEPPDNLPTNSPQTS